MHVDLNVLDQVKGQQAFSVLAACCRHWQMACVLCWIPEA